MKRLMTPLIVLPLLLSGTVHASTDSPLAAPKVAPVVRLHDASAVERKSYVEMQEVRLSQWRQRIVDFNERVETTTTTAGQSAKRDIAHSWDAVERASKELTKASEDNWLGLRAAYERATRDLEATWVKFDPAKS